MRNQIILLEIFTCIILTLTFASAGQSIGITPGRTTLDFSQGLERTVSFSVVNPEKQEVNIVLFAQGELNGSVSLPIQTYTIPEGVESVSLNYTITLPVALSPGPHMAEVVALLLPSKSSTTPVFVGAAAGVATQILVQVPYPGKYAEADLHVTNVDSGGEAIFVIPVFSKGTSDLARVRAVFDIYNKLNEKAASFKSGEISVVTGERKELVTKWTASQPVGTYRVVATLLYDEESLTLERQFTIGKEELELQEVTVPNFRLGDIAKFEMLVENKWSESISGAYAQTQVFAGDGGVLADFKSPTYDVAAQSKKLLVSYWDTAGVKTGTYNAEIQLKYGAKSQQKAVQFKVSDTKIDVIGLGYVISEAQGTGKSGMSGIVTILVIAIVVLVLLNALWFLLLRKKLFSSPT